MIEPEKGYADQAKYCNEYLAKNGKDNTDDDDGEYLFPDASTADIRQEA